MIRKGDSQYTIMFKYLIDDPDFTIFDFDYKFFDELQRDEFERRFCDHYRYREISEETIERWKHQLKTRLNDLYPIYKEKFEALERAKGLDYLANKDLLVEEIRKVQSANTNNSTTNSTSKDDTTSLNNTTSTENSDNNSTSKESQLNNINARVDNDRYKTGMTNTIDENNSSSRSNSNDSSTTNSTNNSSSQNKGTENVDETYRRHEKGNIGVVSLATLVRKYMQLIQNEYDLIGNMIEDCWDLFFLLY